MKLQQFINETLHSQLPKNICKKAHRIAIDLVLIPCHGEHQYRLDEASTTTPVPHTPRTNHHRSLHQSLIGAVKPS